MARRTELTKQIEIRKSSLQSLINSVKTKLQSKSRFSDVKRKEREAKVGEFLQSIPSSQDEVVGRLENIKLGLSKKLNLEEINGLCEVQDELARLKISLGDLECQQQ